jgi:Type VI secretion system/phage-baseplate injector OB domain
MSRIIEIIRRVVQQEMARQRGSALGVVTTVFPHTKKNDENNYEANVRLKHEDLELRKVPLAVGHVGIAAPPRAGDLVLVQFPNGDINQPVITGHFYHNQERPPLHNEDEILFEHRLPDGKLNHLRFTNDGTIYLQREVTKPEDNSEAKAGVKMDKDGNIEIKAGKKIVVTLTNDDKIAITAEDKPIEVTCKTMTINGELVVTDGAKSTTIKGNEITGA